MPASKVTQNKAQEAEVRHEEQLRRAQIEWQKQHEAEAVSATVVVVAFFSPPDCEHGRLR